ncbi:hypothetical protein A2311_02000 [candidate division WOR-1 bacterium RIFOXYB2_FULL_48_7]|uniref:DUF4058 domain-containing protein n=1 Tax=candidate division WOR-1 bacterium RIFOXYB2_FULL_48_7 TaxID=1802583 RepID=A0A1F4TMP4_UNCSA|nr:MAG: hypothetical protein A2311_02000 [candidate division WOR-1 bacterium RIFOXYB2_FULL_48_7]
MDPYIERPEIWPDFHDSLIAAIRGALQPLLRPRYAAVTQDRLYDVEAERPIRPDVSVVRTSARGPSGSEAAVLEADAPAVFELSREEIRQPLIHIVEPAAGNRLVTAIEVLSPDNKTPGPGRTSYLKKRDELWDAGVNLVEIDLLRAGELTVRIAAPQLETLRPWRYLAAVTRRSPPRQEIYAVPLERRLPRIAIPLAEPDQDVTLDLQAPFTRCWNDQPLHHGQRIDAVRKS